MDLHWLSVVLAPRLDDLPHPNADLVPWLQLISGSSWIRMLNAARKVVHAPNVAAHASDASHDTTAVFFCYDCGRTFPSMMLLNNHAHRSHGYVSPVRSYIIDLQCKACLTTFGTRERLVQHLRNFKTNDCLSVLASVYQPIPSPMVAALDADALF